MAVQADIRAVTRQHTQPLATLDVIPLKGMQSKNERL